MNATSIKKPMSGSPLVIEGSARLVPSFDYSTLADAKAVQVKAAAERIRRRVQKQFQSIAETGADLIAMKAILDHGQFGEWIASECAMSDRTARNYMSVSRSFEGKTATIADLPPATVYALASPTVTEETRAGLIRRMEDGERS